MDTETAMDEVTDLVANIEMHRQEIEKESGSDAARTYALGRLREALQLRQEQSVQDGSGGDSPAIIEALTAAIRRVETQSGGAGQRQAESRSSAPAHRQSRRDRPRRSNQPNQSRGRRNTGRRPGR
jgi:hypothetical protein